MIIELPRRNELRRAINTDHIVYMNILEINPHNINLRKYELNIWTNDNDEPPHTVYFDMMEGVYNFFDKIMDRANK
jgi:hypothetical protein